MAKTTVYVASSSRTDLVTAWEVVRDAFGDHDAPSTLLGVVVLGSPGQLVEVESGSSMALALLKMRSVTRRGSPDGGWRLPAASTSRSSRPRSADSYSSAD